MRLSANARYEVDATTIMRLVRLINRTKGLDLKSKELPDMVQLTVNAPRLRITDTGHFAKLMLCDALEFLAARDGLLRVRMSVDGVWAD